MRYLLASWRGVLWSWGPEAAIMSLAAILRLGWPGLTEFKLDEATLASAARGLALGHSLPLAGPATSQGLSNGPLSIYLLAVPFMISPNPLVAILFVGALNLLAVLGAYLIARHWLGRPAALVIGLLYATSPWAVFLTRKLWVQALTPPFIVTYAGAGFAFAAGSRRALIVHVICLAALLQTYTATLALIPATLILLAASWRQISWRALAVAGVVSGLIFLPYTLYQAQRGWPDIQVSINLAHQSATVDTEALTLAWIVTVGSDIHSLAGADAFRDYLATVPDVAIWLTLEGLIVIAGLVQLLWWIIRPPSGSTVLRRAIALFLLMWMLAPILLLTRHAMPIFLHYFLVLLPAPYILAGLAISILWRQVSAQPIFRAWARLIHMAVPITIITIAISQATLILAMLRFIASHNTPAFGTPLAYRLETARRVCDLAASTGAAEVIIVSEGDNPAWHETPSVFDMLLGPCLPRRYANGSTTEHILLPGGPTIILMAPGEWPAERLLATWADLMPATEVVLRPGEGRFRILSALPGAARDRILDPPVRLDNGVEFLGYAVSGELLPGRNAQLTLRWRITAASDQDYHFFNHLVDGQGQRWGQKDGPSLPPWAWHPGGAVLSTFDLSLAPDLPPGRYWLRTGMYRYPEIENVPVLDVGGNPAGDAVMLGPFVVGSAAP